MVVSVTIKKVIIFGSINEVVNTIENNGVLNQAVNDPKWPVFETLTRRITLENTPERINTVPLPNGNNVPFLLTHAFSEKARRPQYWFDEGQLLPKEDRVKVAKSDIVFFQYNYSIYAAFFTHNNNTINRLKQEVLIKEIWGDIVDAVEFQVEDDFLYWLVYRRMEHDGVASDDLDITGISGYIGLSVEETHRMTGEGERVYELLGTMAFIFGNEPLDSLHVAIRQQTEICSFIIDRIGSTKFFDTEYQGNYCGNHVGKAKQARLCLLIYTVLIPALRAAYELHRGNNEWSYHQRETFVKNIGFEILRRVLPSLGLPDNSTIGQILYPVEQP